MSDPLASANATLAYARSRTQELEVLCNGFLQDNPYTTVTERDGKAGHEVVKVKLTKTIPIFLDNVVADIINNFRSTLDQACYAVSVAGGGKGRDTYFPFHDDATGVTGAKKGGSKEIPGAVFDEIASFKPYKGGDDFLWALNKLCNSNKHRTLVPVGMVQGGTRLSVPGFVQSMNVPNHVWDATKNEMEIARFPIGAPKPDYNFEFSLSVAFHKAEMYPIGGLPVLTVLPYYFGLISRIVEAIRTKATEVGVFK